MADCQYKIPKDTVSMICSMDERFVYCLTENCVAILDLATNQVVKELYRLQDSCMAVSPDGRYFACDHPSESAKSVQVCVYDIADDHKELFRTRIRGRFGDDPPHFTHDGKTILLHTAYPGKVWAVDISTGDCRCLYEVPPEYPPVINVDCSEDGILISVSGGHCIVPTGYVVYYKTIYDPPKIIRFDSLDAEDSDFHRAYLNGLSFPYLSFQTWWLGDHHFLVQYNSRGGTVFQIADVRQETIPVSEAYCHYSFPFSNANVNFSADRKFAVINGDIPCKIIVFQPDTGKVVWSEQKKGIYNSRISSHCKYLLLGAVNSEIIPLTL